MCKIFKDVSFEIEDLLLLEAFQIGYLPGWIPEPEFAVVLNAYPHISDYLVNRQPAVTDFIHRLKSKCNVVPDHKELARCCEKVTSTIGDLLGYNRYPEVYDAADFHDWDVREITDITPLTDKVIIDGGSGTGRVALEAAQSAKWVFAIEPVTRLRQFIREKSENERLNNVFVMDGFLHCIPLPDDFADIMITSHALSWKLHEELVEFERVVKKGGSIIHCPGTADQPSEEAIHSVLVSPDWNYACRKYEEFDGVKRKYWKHI